MALVLQTILLPALCLGIVYAFGLEPALAVGMMLLAASPGGTSSNLYSHLAGGDVALNITLTAINSALAILTLPLIVNLSLTHFFGEAQPIPLPFDKMAQVFVIVLGPMLIGMWLRRRFPGLADRMERPVKILSALFLLAVVVFALIQEWPNAEDLGARRRPCRADPQSGQPCRRLSRVAGGRHRPAAGNGHQPGDRHPQRGAGHRDCAEPDAPRQRDHGDPCRDVRADCLMSRRPRSSIG